MNSPFERKGFTLIELMVVVVIIGMLASVAIPTFSKYMMRAKTSEGLFMLRKIYDLEYLFASTQETYGPDAVPCTRVPTFSPVCMYRFPGSGGSGSTDAPPSATKDATRAWYGSAGRSVLQGDSNTHICAQDSFGSFQALGLAAEFISLGSGHGRSGFQDPGYFMYTARTDKNISDKYLPSGNANDTLTIYAYADLNGNASHGNGAFCGSDPYQYNDVTVLSRSMYATQGEVQGIPGIAEANVGE